MFNHWLDLDCWSGYGRFKTEYIPSPIEKSGYGYSDEKKVIELRKKYTFAQLQRNKREMLNIERQIKQYEN
jgi:hypothetical protein